MAAPAIGVRPRWRPSPTTRIDATHPLATRLVAAHLPVAGLGAVDLTEGGATAMVPFGTAPVRMAGRFGEEMDCANRNAGVKMVIGASHKLSIQWPLSVMWAGSYVSNTSTTSRAGLYGCTYDNADSGPYYGYILGINNNAIGEIHSAVNSQELDPGTTTTAGPHVSLFRYDPAASLHDIWLDGVRVGTGGSTSTSAISYASTATFGFSYHSAGAGRETGFRHAFGAVWNRVLSVSEVAQVTADPFCFLQR